MNILHLQIGDPRKLVMAFVGRGVTLPVVGKTTRPDEVKHREWTQKWRKRNQAKGLTADGKPRQRAPIDGRSKNHTAYVRSWRLARKEEARWQWALGNVAEQFRKGILK